MSPAWARAATVFGFGFIVLFSSPNGTALAQTDPSPGVSKEAAAALARMNKTLQGKEFSFVSRTMRAYVGRNGELLHIAHQTKTMFRRPDRLSVDVTGDDGSIRMRYDGKSIVIYGIDQNKYAVLAVSGDIDDALDSVEARTGIDFPLGDLLSDDPGSSLLLNVTAGGQVGTATIDGVRCLHFFFEQAPDMEFELWLEDNERALPRRILVTYLGLPGHPTFLAELSDWNFAVQAADSDFEFHPPADATKVELTRSARAVATPSK